MTAFGIAVLSLAALGLAWGVMELLRGKRSRRHHGGDGNDIANDAADDAVDVLTSIADDDDD